MRALGSCTILGVVACMMLFGTLLTSSHKVELQAEFAAREALTSMFDGVCAKNATATLATLADNVTLVFADHSCSGPFNKTASIATFGPGTYKWYDLLLRPLSYVVAVPGTQSDPTGGAVFVAAFLDNGIVPQALRNETPPVWTFVMPAMATGEIDRNGLLTRLDIHMNWTSPSNDALAAIATRFCNIAFANGTNANNASSPDYLPGFLDFSHDHQGAVTRRFVGQNLSTSLHDWVQILHEQRKIRERAQLHIQVTSAACQRVIIMMTLLSESKEATGSLLQVIEVGAITLDFNSNHLIKGVSMVGQAHIRRSD